MFKKLVCQWVKKAFDSVDHDIVLPKLKFYGIRGKFNELITSYLKNICTC